MSAKQIVVENEDQLEHVLGLPSDIFRQGMHESIYIRAAAADSLKR
jgi:hypothetical protein